MKIVVTGGTGFIGRPLCRLLSTNGHDVILITRQSDLRPAPIDAGVTSVRWDGITRGSWEHALNGAGAVINLAGEPIADRRWTAARKKAIVQSRVGTTRLLVDACASLPSVPPVLINGSAIGYYGPRGDALLHEDADIGSGFLADLCRDWEQAAIAGEQLGMRVVRVRIGMVLGLEGGALPRMLFPFRLFLGGPIAPGTQWVSWIHLEDLARLLQWTVTTASVTGAVNAVSPHPIHMQEFATTLGKILGRPSWLPVPSFVLRVALGELSTLLTTGQRVDPSVALKAGFTFWYPHLLPALSEIFHGAS
jgi:uncharacterized protein